MAGWGHQNRWRLSGHGGQKFARGQWRKLRCGFEVVRLRG